jgi:polysaccharide deacetylase family protein (PEP-CTERM system associated)
VPIAASGPDRTYLFSVDLEDVRSRLPDGDRYAERVVPSTERILEFLARHDARCTFFTVGDVARRYPALVARIAAAGHEVACHGSDHVALEQLGRDGFRDDLLRAADALAGAGARDVRGFRAPWMSLTAKTPWAHDVLAGAGFAYSSSVLPAWNPLYGCAEFGAACRRTGSGVWELPLSVAGPARLALPYASGVYLRVLPFSLVRHLFRRALRGGRPVVGYLHPYDVDVEQERFDHPELGGSRFMNGLMYWNRGRVFARLERLLAQAVCVIPYRRFVEERLEAGARAAAARA